MQLALRLSEEAGAAEGVMTEGVITAGGQQLTWGADWRGR